MEEEEREEFFSFLLNLVVDIGTDVLLKLLERNIPQNETIESFLKKKEETLQQLQKDRIINKMQQAILFRTDIDIELFDISLLYILIQNLTDIEEPLGGWQISSVRSSDTTTGAFLFRLKILRNELMHAVRPALKKTHFQKCWSEAKACIIHLAADVSQSERLSVKRRIKRLEERLGNDNQHMQENLRKLAKWDLEEKQAEILNRVDAVQEKLCQQHSDRREELGEIKTSVQRLQCDIEQIKQSLARWLPAEAQAMQMAQPPQNQSLTEQEQFLRCQLEQLSQMMQSMTLSLYSRNEIANLQGLNREPPITNPTALDSEEIIKISKEIRMNEWTTFATYLGYTANQQSVLDHNYPRQAGTLLHVMLERWHNVVARTDEDVRWLLAAAFAGVGDYRAAKVVFKGDSLKSEEEKCGKLEELRNLKRIPRLNPDIKARIEAITFDAQPAQAQSTSITFNFGAQSGMNMFGGTNNFLADVNFGNDGNQSQMKKFKADPN